MAWVSVNGLPYKNDSGTPSRQRAA